MKNSLPLVIVISTLIAIMILFSKIQNNDIDQKIIQLNQEVEEIAQQESSDNQEEKQEEATEEANLNTDFQSIPDWVYDLGFEEPQNLSFVKDKSKQTFSDSDSDLEENKYDSVELFYSGNTEEIEKALTQIKEKLKVKVNRIEQKKEDSNLIGYTNFQDSNQQPNFLVTLYANLDEQILLVNLTNAKQMKTSVQPNLQIEPTIVESDSIEEINLQLNNN